ncbi:MAG: IgGFc-binding protein [Polyangiaceae bacterium]|nr:IgGFc-binding protein [Polyangiaceae bacterium]
MRSSRTLLPISSLLFLALLPSQFGCSAAPNNTTGGGGAGASTSSNNGGNGGIGGNSDVCDICNAGSYIPCNSDGTPGTPETCPKACAPKLGCVDCYPGGKTCLGNDVYQCTDQGTIGTTPVETCDPALGLTCSNGACISACVVAEGQPSNVGCEFWAVDLDQQDGFNDPASAPWGVALSNAGQTKAVVSIEINEAAPGQPLQLSKVADAEVNPGALYALVLPTRELDCGVQPNDYASPGTCLSSRAFRIKSSAPIVVYQFNVFENAYSNDASLLLPTNALGTYYRVIGWPAGHPVKFGGFNILDRSYVTIVGTTPNTVVKVKPSWRIKGNPPVAATPAGGDISLTIGPFDVLNLETDDGTFQDDPKTIADLSGTLVTANAPVAVFSGVESTGAPGGVVDIPTPPGWTTDNTCCLDHLEDQLFPVESVGKNYVIPRSPVRSTGGFKEPDILRFVGAAEVTNVTTTLPAPFNQFTLQPGEVKTTWTQGDVVVTSDTPVMIGQILVSNQYCDGAYIGDPSLTVFPPVDQYRTEYVILTPGSWNQNWVVIVAEVGTNVSIDGTSPGGCSTQPAGNLAGVEYETRRCPLQEGAHNLSGDKPFGIVAYGYGSAGSYAFVGGADVKKIYDPPEPK